MAQLSPFDPSRQHDHVDNKIVALLERLSQSLRFLLWEEGQKHYLSPIQIQSLVHLLYHESQLNRVGHIAEEFRVTQATMSDVISTLEEKKLVRRVQNKLDKRAYAIQLTPSGKKTAKELSTWANVIGRCIENQTGEEKRAAMQFLMRLVESLQREQVISTARMCLTCNYFRPNKHPDAQSPHHCALIDRPLAVENLRIDCPEYLTLIKPARNSGTA
jgi:DNA-binding MarR family transcriptional regulator